MGNIIKHIIHNKESVVLIIGHTKNIFTDRKFCFHKQTVINNKAKEFVVTSKLQYSSDKEF
jgi:hypothetical protein